MAATDLDKKVTKSDEKKVACRMDVVSVVSDLMNELTTEEIKTLYSEKLKQRDIQRNHEYNMDMFTAYMYEACHHEVTIENLQDIVNDITNDVVLETICRSLWQNKESSEYIIKLERDLSVANARIIELETRLDIKPTQRCSTSTEKEKPMENYCHASY